MLPILLNKGLKHSDILTNTFINAYMADLDQAEYDNHIMVRYATFTDIPEWTKDSNMYSSKIERTTVSGTKKIEDYIMVYNEIPENLTEDYHKFLIGDYSKFSKDYKKQVLEFWEANEDTLIYGVLYKSGKEIEDFWREDLDVDLSTVPDTEYWRPPKLKQEIFGMQGD
jgi:hypothetical protein